MDTTSQVVMVRVSCSGQLGIVAVIGEIVPCFLTHVPLGPLGAPRNLSLALLATCLCALLGLLMSGSVIVNPDSFG